MNEFLKRTWAEIDIDNIEHNFSVCKQIAKQGVSLMGVIKADAYGHGAQVYAKVLSEMGCEWFAVSNLEEALEIRRAGVDTPILILGYTPPEKASELAYNNISQAVFDYPYALKLSECASRQNVQVNIHLKIDTGMTRIGFLYQDNIADGDSIEQMVGVCKMPGLYPQGVFQNFASADEGEHGEVYTRLQYDLFLDAVRRLEGEGIHFEIRHCCNSAATTEYREMQLDACRVGICIYGLKSSKEVKNQDDLKPVMSLKTIVSTVKVIDSGTTVSYGRTFTADKPMKIAVVAIGYADGYPRILSDAGARMIVNGQYAPVVGRICMDMCMLDVTDIKDVKDGDIVTVMGVDAASGKEISADELAEKAQTINYEITCSVSKRVPRVYLKNGKKQSVKNYIS